ncbi:POTE ankyrin domain family member D-like [Clytia hemisphaerica]|uniref:POTE ankyrin domain family member D-like n=1 Tax=Clytia hemisphaerica TaxID=252671 RepID=UPI0034D5E872
MIARAMKESYDTIGKVLLSNKRKHQEGGTNEFGHNALHRAVINDEERTIQKLVANGIDIEEKDSLGFTATQLAIILGKEYLLPYLNGEVIDFETSLPSLSSGSHHRRSSVTSQTSSISSISSIRSRVHSLLQKQRARTISSDDCSAEYGDTPWCKIQNENGRRRLENLGSEPTISKTCQENVKNTKSTSQNKQPLIVKLPENTNNENSDGLDKEGKNRQPIKISTSKFNLDNLENESNLSLDMNEKENNSERMENKMIRSKNDTVSKSTLYEEKTNEQRMPEAEGHHQTAVNDRKMTLISNERDDNLLTIDTGLTCLQRSGLDITQSECVDLNNNNIVEKRACLLQTEVILDAKRVNILYGSPHDSCDVAEDHLTQNEQFCSLLKSSTKVLGFPAFADDVVLVVSRRVA